MLIFSFSISVDQTKKELDRADTRNERTEIVKATKTIHLLVPFPSHKLLQVI